MTMRVVLIFALLLMVAHTVFVGLIVAGVI